MRILGRNADAGKSVGVRGIGSAWRAIGSICVGIWRQKRLVRGR